MSLDTMLLIVTIAFALMIASCGIAAEIGKPARTWACGFFGPIGWIVAALLGLREDLKRLSGVIADDLDVEYVVDDEELG